MVRLKPPCQAYVSLGDVTLFHATAAALCPESLGPEVGPVPGRPSHGQRWGMAASQASGSGLCTIQQK